MGKKYLKDNIPSLLVTSIEDIKGLELIDVRRPEEFNNELGHIEGAKLITIGPKLSEFIQNRVDATPMLSICRSGARSATATLEAMSLGQQEVYNLEGGMIHWNTLKLPVSRND